MFTYLLTGSFGECFLFYGLANLFIVVAWRHRYFLSNIFPLLYPEFGVRFAPICSHDDISLQNLLHPKFGMRLLSPWPLFKNWFSLFFISAWRKKGAISALDSSQSFSLYLLPSGHRVQASVGLSFCWAFRSDSYHFHPSEVTEYR